MTMTKPESRTIVGTAHRNTAICRHRLGNDLRRLRQARSLRLEDVAAQLGLAPSTLSRIETGQAPTRTGYLHVMLDIYQVDDPAKRKMLTDLARAGHLDDQPVDDLLTSTTRRYLGLEAAASQIRCYSVQTVPGLLQTASYAAAALRAARPGLIASQVDSLVQITLNRQVPLHSGQTRLHAIICEPALFAPIAPADVIAAQLDHLAAIASAKHVTLQIHRLTTARPLLSAPFTLLSFTDPAAPDIACTPSADGQIILSASNTSVGAIRSHFAAITRAAMTTTATAQLLGRTSHPRG